MYSNEKQQKHAICLLFFLCWIIYFISYLGRRNLSAAMTSMIQLGILTTAQAGSINTAFFISYAVGQFINGILADRFSPKYIILTGLSVASLSNVVMAITQTPWTMLFFWALNGYAMAMLWPPILRIFTIFFDPEHCMRSSVHMATAPVAGAITSYVFYAFLLSFLSWKAPFYFAAGALLCSALFWYFGFTSVESILHPIPQTKSTLPVENNRFRFLSFLGPLWIPLMIPVLAQGMLRDGITTWVPTYLAETFLLSPDFAVGISVLLPIANLAAPYSAQFCYRKIFQNELITAALFFALTTLFSLAFVRWGSTNLWLGLALFAIITTCMEAANTLLVTILPLRFTRFGKPASMSGFMNFLTYIGSALSTFGVGALVNHFGWGIALPIWCSLAGIGLLFCLLVRKLSIQAKI